MKKMKQLAATLLAIILAGSVPAHEATYVDASALADANAEYTWEHDHDTCDVFGMDDHCHDDHCHDCEEYAGAGIKIALLDAGVSEFETKKSVSFVGESINGSDHGNSMAAVLMSQVPEADIYDVKVLDDEGHGTYASVVAGINWAIENGADIISMSFVGTDRSALLEDALARAYEAGILVVAAAGNYSDTEEVYPAAYPTVLAVGAVNELGQTTYSNYGDYVDAYVMWNDGTSGAAQSIAGTAAYILGTEAGITVDQLYARFSSSEPEVLDKYDVDNADAIVYACESCYTHYWGSWKVTRDSTCYSTGTRERKCSRCGKVEKEGIAKKSHVTKNVTDVASTCTSAGRGHAECTLCGATITGYQIAPKGHNFSDWSTTKAVTCTEDGTQQRTCSRCQVKETKTIKSPGGHKWDSWKVTTANTCGKDGVETRVCLTCNQKETRVLPKTGNHTPHGNYKITKAATCTTDGSKYLVCDTCGANCGNETIPALGHNYGSWNATKAATCTTDGSKQRVCSRCNDVETATIKSPGGHKWDSWKVTTANTCGKDGVETRVCLACNQKETRVLPKTDNHTWVLTSKASATCTEYGYELYTCSVCKQTKKDMIDLIEHNYVPVTTKQPTKSENGTLSYVCSHCDAPLTTKTLYLISYDGNGAVSGTMPADQIKVSGSTLTLSANTPKRDGYRFKGWGTTTSEATYQPGDPYDKEARMNLYAIWEPDQYTIEFDVNGGIGSNFTRTIAYGSTYSKVDKPSRAGYTFAGWYTAKTGGSQITETTIMSTAKDHTVYAHWTTNSYTVTFDKNGGSGSNITRSIAFGSTYGKVDNPIRSGYTFKGWYTAKTGGSQVTETTLMTTAADHTVYARWTATGSASGGSSSCRHSMRTVGYVAPDCTHDGYEIQSCGRCGMTVQRSIKAYGHDFYTEVVVQPTCVNDGYSVTKCRKCGIVSQTRMLATVPSHTFTTTRVEPTGSQDGYEKVSCEKCGFIKSNKVLSLCGVMLDPQNGKTNMTVSAIQGEEYGDILPTVSKTGYNFKGWYTAKTGGTKITTTSIVPNSTVVQLYARWSIKTYTVTFDANGGTGGPTSMKKTYGTASVIPEEVPTMPGYECIGWAESLEDANAKKVTYKKGDYFTRNKKMTLYAVWTQRASLVRTDEMGMSIYISYSCVDQLKEEVNSWDGINDTLDCASTDGYPMLDQIRNALYYESSDYRLRDVCLVVKSSMDQVNMSGLEYLEIRIPKSTFSITLLGVYTTEVVQNQDTWEWFNLDSFSAVISNYHTTELSEVLEEGKHYFANQGDYEDDEELFLPELLKIIMDDIDYDQMPDNPTVRAAVEAFIEALKNKRLEGTVGGGMCGPMAAVNMALYFTDPDKQVTKEEVREELLNYFRMENRGFSWVERDISSGDGWSSICDYLDTKLKPLGLDASAGIEGIQAGGSKKQLELTKKMISEEIPVIMSFASETEKLRMLRMAENGKDLYEDTRNPVNSHYVIVTGVYESARGESVYLKVASWGEEYYINWNEYVAKANRGIVGDVGCGYVVIK